MARIVGVHGIGQQVRGPEVLRDCWGPALRDGVVLSGAEPPDDADLVVAFYGDLFRAQGGKAPGGGPPYNAVDVEDGFETELPPIVPLEVDILSNGAAQRRVEADTLSNGAAYRRAKS